jgi:MOSC domain-containing protein YiiM
MAEHRPTDYLGTITWLGAVPQDRHDIRSVPVQSLYAGFAGIEGAFHSGLTRRSCVRVTAQHPKGTVIRNTRQFSILSAEEMAEIAVAMGQSAIDPLLLGASIVVEGIPDFSHVPPTSRLQTTAGTTLVVDVENGPCNLPAREMERERAGGGKGFKAAARGRRGVTAWVLAEGPLSVGDRLRLHVPDQRPWAYS